MWEQGPTLDDEESDDCDDNKEVSLLSHPASKTLTCPSPEFVIGLSDSDSNPGVGDDAEMIVLD